MPRPLKHPSVRQRRNVASSAATLHVLAPDEIVIPELPQLFDKDGNERSWSTHTQNWWVDIWSAPMAPEYHKSDIHGLYRMAAIVEAFWTRGRLDLNSELRLYEQQFGLNPLARRRLEWQIEDTDEKQDKGEKRRHAQQPSEPEPEDTDGDPYAALA
jgi:hypothetical protein